MTKWRWFASLVILSFFVLVMQGCICGNTVTCTDTSNSSADKDNGSHPPDLIFANDTDENRICLNDSRGEFQCRNIENMGNSSSDVTQVHLDGDGHSDVVFSNAGGEESRLCRGLGRGQFVCSNLPTITRRTRAAAAADFDNDNKTDLVFARRSSHSNPQNDLLCLGDGKGQVSCAEISSTSSDSVSLGEGHLNSDANADVVFTNWGQVNQVCLGDGSANFSCQPISADTNTTVGVAIEDVNRDSEQDIILANNGERNRICLGDGSGLFSCSDLSSNRRSTWGVAVADFDMDGHLDVFVANTGAQKHRLCLGDGSGSFSCSDLWDSRLTEDVVTEDFNGDGAADVVFANYAEPNQICFGDGNAGFSCRDISSDANVSVGVAAGIFD